MEILDILINDKRNRHKNGKLFNQDDLEPYSSAMVKWNNVLYLNNMYWCTCKEKLKIPQKKDLDEKINFLDRILVKESMGFNLIDDLNCYRNFVIAGGFFTADNEDEETDIDIFLYDNHEETLKELVSYLMKIRGYSFSRRTQYYVQLDYNEAGYYPPIQIILRKYTTIAEILYGFDIGSSQICYNGNKLKFTVLSKFAFEASLNIVDTSRLSPTYESRLIKYIKRGFSIVFPFLSKILVNNFKKLKIGNFKLKPLLSVLNEKIYGEEYNAVSIGVAKNPRYATKLNIQYLLGITTNFIVDEHDELIISAEGVKKFYKKLLTLENPNPRYYLNFDTNNIRSNSLEMASYLEYKTKEVINYIKNNYSSKIGLTWITKNPGQQLTSSITPLFTYPWYYYGKFYNPVWTPETNKYCPIENQHDMRLFYNALSSLSLIKCNDIYFHIMKLIALFQFCNPPKHFEERWRWKNLKRKRKEVDDNDDCITTKYRKTNNGEKHNDSIIIIDDL